MSQPTPATGSHNAVVVRAGQAETVGHRPTTVRPLADASVSATGGALTTIRVATRRWGRPPATPPRRRGRAAPPPTTGTRRKGNEMRLSPQGVARWSAKRRFTVIAIWVGLFLVGALLTSRYLSGALTTQAQFTNNPESKQAQQLLEQRLTGPRRSNEVVIVRSDSRTVSDPAFRAYVQRLLGDLDGLKPAVVQQTTDPYQAGGALLRSP
jgi:hypothetical protein